MLAIARRPLSLTIFSSTAVKVSSTCLGILVTVLLARLLGPTGFGLYSYVFAIISVAGIFVQFGLPYLVMRETARGDLDADWPRVKSIWKWSSGVVLGLSLGVILVGAGVVWALLDPLDRQQLWTLIFGALLVPMLALGALRGAALRGLRRVVIGLLPEHVLRPAFFVVLLLASAVLFSPLSAAQAMGLHVAAAFLAFAGGAVMLWYCMPAALRHASTGGEGGHGWWRASLALGLAAGMHQINNYADILILGLFRPAEDVGYYRVAYQVSILVVFGLQIVGLVVAPQFARLSHQSDREGLQRLVTSSARLATLAALLVIGVLAVWGEALLILAFGAAYSASLSPLLILAAAHLVCAFFGPVAVLMNMSGHEREVAVHMAISAACNVALNFVLIPPKGIEGAAIAMLLTFVVLNLSLWHRARRTLDINVAALAGHVRARA